MPADSLGPQLVGERIKINSRTVQVLKQLGEGGFSFVYLVREESNGNNNSSSNTADGSSQPSSSNSRGGGTDRSTAGGATGEIVLKITSIHSRQQRDIAEKEAKLLSRLSHPSIVRMYDTCYRSTPVTVGGRGGGHHDPNAQPRPQHMILMEYCEGGTALAVCNALKKSGQRFDLPSLIIAFGQISNAVSYLHAQRPPIVHRDLKPVNFLVKNGAYKLCDFGSATFGHVDLRSSSARSEAEEVIQKTTTQMFRAPEMVDLYMCKKLTQATDIWALGVCLYSMAFFQNCFEEGSNLAILSRKYKIPDDNPYGDGIVELIDRMLTVDVKARADMTEVILCLSAIYSGRPLPPRKRAPKKKEHEVNGLDGGAEPKVGAYRTDGQGIQQTAVEEPKKPAEAKKLDPNSAAARRKRAVIQSVGTEKTKFEASFSELFNNNKDGDGAADPFGQPVTYNDGEPLSLSAMGGGGGGGVDHASAFPAFHDADIPTTSADGKDYDVDDSFDIQKVPIFNKQPNAIDLSADLMKKASIKERRAKKASS
mmetsp:Transcript_28366/g.62344  ORF Transcript_28366/g.62344 Transcript_28366/m.62344 type:complete len:537 (-) Transcript_28366:184-1794(-)